ncbi:hypothetical protein WMF20_49560 [Sorangium sp. So ce834]|uniref:hypothetical protein n=1 Tax=Sorangium sp. So ce834 TaxID=3133321 RepID=UPI003F5E5EDB
MQRCTIGNRFENPEFRRADPCVELGRGVLELCDEARDTRVHYMSRRDRAVQLGAMIQADRILLTEVRERLKTHEAELDALLRGEGPPDTPDGSGRQGAGSIAKAVADLLSADPDRPFSAEEIVARLGGEHKLTSLRSTLARMADNLEIVRVGRGRYRAAKGAHAKEANGAVPHGEGGTIQ